MRSTINVSLPPDLAKIVRVKAKALKYASVSEYIRKLIRDDLRHGAIREMREETLQRRLVERKFEIRQGYNPVKNGEKRIKEELIKLVGRSR